VELLGDLSRLAMIAYIGYYIPLDGIFY